MRLFRVTSCLLALSFVGGCAQSSYYLQLVNGHMQVMGSARPIQQWLADVSVDHQLKRRLELAQRMRDFAVTELQLPDNSSYRYFADLNRGSALWNVVAAPELSLTAKTWCFPVTGCVAYRGYFDEGQARAKGKALKDLGFDVHVYGVPMYSTLGWLDWAGGDPLLNTVIAYPEGELARIIFHELAHQVLYRKGDTMFNESFATSVERIGTTRWLELYGSAAARAEYAEFDDRRRQFKAISTATRGRLSCGYATNGASGSDRAKMLAAKNKVFDDFRDEYAKLKSRWGGYRGYDAWVADVNNASFAAQAAYDQMVPEFETLFAREGGDWRRFYDAVRSLAQVPREARAGDLQPSLTEHSCG